ncbi:MAG: tRNA uridine-5-carboxymethylaminomethyl(34) synthesis enzyme MnmG [Acidobacteria bacterium 13_1_40CM_3_56_11]|nr:MAG: tRNA uridine-5-carboxymethylaminomethyl(34) synthesis enzyme MnmG [Acidobacteria bacterium 13_1_40CM_56_16]OLD21787.1 MAG: tRNA uridine-5-carboxymethylaminomethyl(34) synthesis enzyme MnmG [Acidobacteria bacterium 13_1_40CM_3_56_11]
MMFDENYDVVVVGAGHAGCEAAHAAAQTGLNTALYTMNADLIAQMSCNPAIGGIAKGHLVREIDALGGVMGVAADEAGIQFRLLNTSRGPAVWSPRAQADKAGYRYVMRRILERTPNLFIKQAEVTEILFVASRVAGIELLDGRRVAAAAVVLTTGTFLNGLIHIGEKRFPAGRNGEPASIALGNCIRNLGFDWGRLKTGTPPRLDRRTIDFSVFESQYGDPEPTPFSFQTTQPLKNKICCYITHTDEKIHSIIRSNMSRSPLYSGQIKGIGPRYCPSIEDKVVKFQDKDRHQIVLEPEGVDTHEIYVNGMSTSLPIDVQREILSSMKGLESAQMIRPGYAIEYDFVQPTELHPSLETKKVEGFFFAGQINGTTGYEEAAAQGLVAGINAALKVKGEEPLVLNRADAYIGIMVDDLVTKGTNEPYRMFTSRAEFRLNLRIDNADERLTPVGRRIGLVTGEHWNQFLERRARIARLRELVQTSRVNTEHSFFVSRGLEFRSRPSFIELVRRPEIHLADLIAEGVMETETLRREDIVSLETSIKYEGYLKQQEREVEKLRKAESKRLPPDLDYAAMPGLSREIVEKLNRIRPQSIAQASRIPGITPASISILLFHLEMRRKETQPKSVV